MNILDVGDVTLSNQQQLPKQPQQQNKERQKKKREEANITNVKEI